MLRITQVFFIILLLSIKLSAQLSYFQQQVNYKIEVALDDNKHFIQGKIEMEYFNNSPDTLDKLYMHLWGNAYKNNKTAFAKQNIHSGSRKFYFSEPGDRGYMGGIDFKLNGQKAAWTIEHDNPDIALILLDKKLLPGQKIMISTSFLLKIPAVFSRLGHDMQNYYMTQWYPKPAVYDKEGWHPIPYLNQGEFYSEFGNYEVSITLPANYLVAATGELQNEEEKSFLERRISQTSKFLEGNLTEDKMISKSSSAQTKTITYLAKRVHDFAWFASKDFLVSKDVAVLVSGTKVPTYGFYTLSSMKAWSKSAFYVKRAIEYYSERIGEYPWPFATAVFGDLKAGGGMEYPMITILNIKENEKTVDDVIAHEVGHNWFYGILATNERDHAWMDEGINTYYEDAYMSKFYPSFESGDRFRKFNVVWNESTISKFFHLRKLDQPLSLSSASFAQINYGLDVYAKTARYFKLLDEYLGRSAFDNAMKAYYREWSFKHPTPYDLQRILEHETAKDLSWLFQNLIDKNQMVDYKIASVKGDAVILKNNTLNPVPVSIGLYKDSLLISRKWLEGFNGKQEIKVDMTGADKLILDDNDLMYDIHKSNNYYNNRELLKYCRPLKIRFYGINEDREHQHINLSPILGWNNGDKTMIGVGIHSDPLPGHAFRYYLLPMYSLVNNYIVGQMRAELNFYSYNKVERFVVGLFAKSYTHDINSILDYTSRYIKLAPYVSIELGRWKSWTHKLTYIPNVIYKENAEFNLQEEYIGQKSNKSLIHTLDYDLSNNNTVSQNNTRIRLEQQSYNQNDHYLKLSIDWHNKFYYAQKRSIDLRVFIGGFLDNTRSNSGSVNTDEFARGSMSLSSSGADDYLFEGPYLGRTATTGFFSRQVDLSDGGMKFPKAYAYGQFGYSNSFLAAVNFKASIPAEFPLKLPIKPYFDMGYYHDLRPINSDRRWTENIVWSGGLMFDFGNILGFYFPVINSNNLEEQYKQSLGSNYLKRVTFTIQLPVTRLTELIKRYSFE